MVTRPFILSLFFIGALFVGALSSSSLSAASSAMQQPTEATAEALTPEEQAARATFARVCSACHESAVATTTLRNRQEWGEILEMMSSFGASASEAEFMQIERYLLGRYGRVNVNRAPADELQQVLKVSPEVAQTLIDYRSMMRLSSPDDLKKVAGFEPAKVDALKAHLQF